MRWLLVFEAPWNGARTTGGSGPRCELRETKPDGSKYNWPPLGTNALAAICAVNSAGTSSNRQVIIGQIHSVTASNPPVVLSYNFTNAGQVTATVQYHPNGSGTPRDQNYTLATNVHPGDLINYKLALERNGGSINLRMSVNGTTNNISMTSAPYDSAWTNATFYFKAGCYYPNNPPSGAANVTFSSLSVTHQ